MSQDTAIAWAWTMKAGWIDAAKAQVAVSSPSFLYGETLFESVRAHRGIWLALKGHYQRLIDGQNTWGWNNYLPNFDTLEKIFKEGINRLGSAEGYGRITVWPPSGGGPGLLPSADGGCLLLIAPLNGASEMVMPDVKIGIAQSIGRDHWALPYDLKHGNYLPSLWGAREARERGIDDVILCRRDGNPVEASSSNLLVFDGERWFTPVLGRDGLDGIGRRALIEQGVVREAVVARSMLESASSIALVNSVRGLRFASALEDRNLQVNGKAAQMLREGWDEVIREWMKIGARL